MDDDRTFEQAYPTLARWVKQYGGLKLGHVEWSRSLIRALDLDEGGLVWEGGATAPTLSAAVGEAETALAVWLREQVGDR